MTRQFGFIAILAAALWAQPNGIEGTWQGTLDVGALKLRLGLHVTRTEKGEFTSTFDSIDQNAMGLPVAVTTFAGRKLHLEMPNLKATFDGELSGDGSQIAGTFTQGTPFPLTFKRVEKVEALSRPQNPRPPYPYDAEEVAYETKPGVKLGGTLTLPRGQGPFPAALMITGSGPQDRDESLMGHKPFWVIADYLTRRGIAILRVDDRGVGKSTGSSMRTTIEEMAADVLTGIDYLKARKEIDPKRIGVIGHSEGGIVGPLAASRSPEIAFVVLLAGTGVSGDKVLELQGRLVARSMGIPDETVAQNGVMQKAMFEILRSEPDETAAREKMKAAWEKIKASAPEERRKQLAAGDATLQAQISSILSPEIRSFVLYDPAGALRKLKVPVLAMNGARDIQVPPQQNLPAIVAALTEGGNADVTAVELPGLNHLFQKCKTCTVAEYGMLEETFSPAALELLGDWLARHTRAQ